MHIFFIEYWSLVGYGFYGKRIMDIMNYYKFFRQMLMKVQIAISQINFLQYKNMIPIKLNLMHLLIHVQEQDGFTCYITGNITKQ